MKRAIALYLFLFICFGIFAQKNNNTDNTQDRNKKSDQDTRYTEVASGVKRSISYKFSNLLSDEDPGNGTFRYNKDTISKIDYIFIDIIDQSGEDQTKWYSTWDDTTGATARGRLNIVEYEGKNVNVFDITGVYLKGNGYWKIPVKYVSGSLPADGTTYYYIFERIENKDKKSKTDKENQVIAAEAAVAAVVVEAREDTKPVQAEAPLPEIKEVPVSVVDTVRQEVKTEEVVAAVVAVAAVVDKPIEVTQPQVQIVEEKKEEVPPVTQPEPVVEVKEEPVVQPDTIKQEIKIEKAAEIVTAVAAVAVVAETKEEPVVQITQPETVVEVKEEQVAQPEPLPVQVAQPEPTPPVPVVEEKKADPVQPEQVAEEKKPEAAPPVQIPEETKPIVAEVGVVAVASQAEKPTGEPRIRTSQESKPVSNPVATQASQTKTEAQPVQNTKPTQTAQQAPVSQPRAADQSSQPQQQAPVKKETPASQPAPKTTQPVQQTPPSQPAWPAPTTQTPSTGSSGTGYSFARRTDGSRIWHGIIETGYGIKVSDYGLSNYRINFISSFRLGPHFIIGLGLGYRRYFDKPEKHMNWYMVASSNQVPVFLDLRVLLSKKKLTPYLALGLGSSTEKSKSDTTSYGSFINPSAGIWYRLSKNTALFADIAWEMMDLEYALHADNIPYRRKNNSLSLNIGIQF